MSDRSSFQRLLQHAQQLLTLGNAADVLAASCRELVAFAGSERVFATCCLARQTWEHGLHIEGDHAGTRPVDPAARSALFAIHRRILANRTSCDEHAFITRGDDTAAVFRGLRCPDGVDTISVFPIVHRTGRIWGELVLIGRAEIEGLGELARFVTVALENAQRLAFARRDQDRLLLLSEATDDAFYDWDFDTRDFWWGGGILKLFGSDADPVENTARWKRDRIHPDDFERVRLSFDQARFANAMQWSSEYRFRRNDDSYCHVEERGYFLRDVGGRAYRMLGSMRDVSTMKRLLALEQQSRAAAESASRAKDEFLAMLGHELRNPLAPIISGLELLRTRGTLDLDKDLSVLHRQAQHLIRLVDDLLDIARIANGKIELKRERIDIAGVIAAAIETAHPLIESRLHTLELDVPPGLDVDADRARLAQAIANLLTNAAKYTEPGGTITVTTERAGSAIVIRVRDTGIGIAPEMLPRIFNMFVQERQALDRSQGGLGLGLAIVRNLIELHGGTVEPHSEGRGRGSEFEVRLPIATVTAYAEVREPIAPRTATIQGRKIMVVDDNEDAAAALSALLEYLGNTTRVAHDADGALQLADEFAPELAVLDIGLPVIDGYELARRLRARGRTLHLIALTGYGQASDKEQAVRAGFDAHLVKPVEISTLQDLIARLADRP